MVHGAFPSTAPRNGQTSRPEAYDGDGSTEPRNAPTATRGSFDLPEAMQPTAGVACLRREGSVPRCRPRRTLRGRAASCRCSRRHAVRVHRPRASHRRVHRLISRDTRPCDAERPRPERRVPASCAARSVIRVATARHPSCASPQVRDNSRRDRPRRIRHGPDHSIAKRRRRRTGSRTGSFACASRRGHAHGGSRRRGADARSASTGCR